MGLGYLAGICRCTSHKIYNICMLLFPLLSVTKWIDLENLWEKGGITLMYIYFLSLPLCLSFSFTLSFPTPHIFASIHTATGRVENEIPDSQIYSLIKTGGSIEGCGKQQGTIRVREPPSLFSRLHCTALSWQMQSWLLSLSACLFLSFIYSFPKAF